MIIQRRSFLLGLGAVIAAPAIVKPQNIMPIKLFDPYYTRYLMDYLLGSDELALRIDRSLSPLKIAKHMQLVPAHIAHKFIPKIAVENLKPPEGQQKYLHTIIPWEEGYKISQEIDKWRD
jgi:hypothetical protein